MKSLISVGMLMVACLQVACTANDVAGSIRQSVQDNRNAQSKIDWDSSWANPQELFARWLGEAHDLSPEKLDNFQMELCESLLSLEPRELSIFENHLRDPQYLSLVTKCQDRLLTRLDDFFASQKRSSSRQAWFRHITETRDISRGYQVVTGDLKPKQVVLTFDDGPSGVYTPRILQSLREVNAKAIFFALGKNVRSNAQVLRDVVRQGHAVGSHSWSHPCLGSSASCAKMHGRNFSFAEAVEEIARGHRAIFEALGQIDPFFRFPYGESSGELRAHLASRSVAEFYWSVDSEDWKAQTVPELVNSTIEKIEKRRGGVVLFHDIQRRTVEALPYFLEELFLRGYEVVLLQAQDPHAKYNPRIPENVNPIP